MVEDFLYICDGAYVHDELIKMEIEVLKTIGFDLGIPLSYRFLRRYTRVSWLKLLRKVFYKFCYFHSAPKFQCLH